MVGIADYWGLNYDFFMPLGSFHPACRARWKLSQLFAGLSHFLLVRTDSIGLSRDCLKI